MVFNKDIDNINLEEICTVKNSIFYNMELDQFLHLHDDKELDEQLKKEFKEFLGENMQNMNKEEMLWCLAEIATAREIQVDWSSKTKEENFKALSVCDELNCDIEDIVGSTEHHIVDIIENTYRDAEDNDEILLIFRITRKSDNSIGYLRYKGRYSSWDSSSYYICDIVYPRKIETIIYETKLEQTEK